MISLMLGRLQVSSLCVLLLSGCQDPDRKAMAQYQEAVDLIQHARESEKESYGEALKNYEEAASRLDTITTQFLRSSLAKRLEQGEAVAGLYTMEEFKDKVLPLARRKAEAEKDLFSCALLVAESVTLKETRVHTLIRVAAWMSKAGMKKEASKTMAAAEEAAAAVPNVLEREKAYAAIALAHHRTANQERAMAVAEKVTDFYYHSELMARMAQELVEGQDKTGAADLLEKALKTARKIEAGYNRYSLFEMIAILFARAGRFEKALEVASDIQWGYQQDRARIEIAAQCAAAGQFDMAFEAIRPIQDLSTHSTGAARIAVARAEAGDFKRALKGLENIGDTYQRCCAMADIAEKLHKAGKKDRAPQILASALEEAGEIKIADFKYDALGKISTAYMRIGKPKQALDLTSSIGDLYATSNSLCEIASEYARLGDMEQAAELFARAAKNAEGMDFTLVTIAGRSAGIGLLKESLEIADKIESDSFRTTAIEDIMDACCLAGPVPDAADHLLKALTIIAKTREARDLAPALSALGAAHALLGLKPGPESQPLLHQMLLGGGTGTE
jgi:hypothetical protein